MLVDICSICFNESLLLPTWIERWLSVAFVNKIYIVDGGSTDRSVEVAKSYDRVSCITVPWKGDFARQRNISLKLSRPDIKWVVSPDIDEIPCGAINGPCKVDFTPAESINEIVIPYIKFYDWDKLWFFKQNVPAFNFDKKEITYALNKSTTTIYRKDHLAGYTKSLHEMPILKNEKKWMVGSHLGVGTVHLDNLKDDFFIGHCDQLKHFQESRRCGVSVEESMGLKRARYRLISDAVYDGKVYNKEWAIEAFKRHEDGDKGMMEDLGAAQLKSFMDEHVILSDYDATILWEKMNDTD